MTLPRKCVSWLLIYCFVVSVAAGNPHARTDSSRVQENSSDEDEGLRFRLSEGTNQPDARPVTNAGPATSLSNAETEAVLKRIPPIKSESNDETEFARRTQSLPPPRTGGTVMHPFPAANEVAPPRTTSAATLDLIRFSPEGDVPIAPNLSVTFSQPMIAITSQEEAAKYVPVKLEPEVPGKWRWLGTKTLLFEPDVRFPMATKFSITVPAGTKSANGETLSNAKSWTFTTPAPTVKRTYPDTSLPRTLDTLMFVEFDQRIDPAAVLKTIKLTPAQTPLSLRLATNEEIEADQTVKELVRNAEKDRWLAFRAIDRSGNTERALPGNTYFAVTIGPGTPSMEGPRTTYAKQEFYFSTFGPLHVTKYECGYNAGCKPPDWWRIEFNNPIDATAFQESQVKIQPAMEGLKPAIQGNTLVINGSKKPDTSFKLTLDKSLADIFGQNLGKDVTLEFRGGSAAPMISLSGGGLAVLDPNGPRKLSLYTVNYQTVKVDLYVVEPGDWVTFQIYRQLRYRGPNDPAAKRATLPGRLISSKQLELKNTQNEMIETAIDLEPAFKNGFGQAIVVVDSITPVSDLYHSQISCWVQATQIGLDAFVDNKQLIGWASSLVDGAPLRDVKMEIIPTMISGTTGTDGLANLQLKPVSDSEMSVLVARRGDDVAILPENPYVWWRQNGSWHQKPQPDELVWYVFDDRKLYRPGEVVHVKGWIRRLGTGIDGNVGPLSGAIKTLSYVIEDNRDNEVSKGVLTPNAFGGFDLAFKLPANTNLGDAAVKFETTSTSKAFDKKNFSHNFQVQEFRRPEFEVTAKNETEGPLFVGEHADISVVANYFAGGGLSNTEVEWRVSSLPTTFTPPNRGDYTFGKWIPWWIPESENDQADITNFSGRTDASGKHRLRIAFYSGKPGPPQH